MKRVLEWPKVLYVMENYLSDMKSSKSGEGYYSLNEGVQGARPAQSWSIQQYDPCEKVKSYPSLYDFIRKTFEPFKRELNSVFMGREVFLCNVASTRVAQQCWRGRGNTILLSPRTFFDLGFLTGSDTYFNQMGVLDGLEPNEAAIFYSGSKVDQGFWWRQSSEGVEIIENKNCSTYGLILQIDYLS